MYTFNQLFKKHLNLCYSYKRSLTVADNNKLYHFNNVDIDEKLKNEPRMFDTLFNLQDDTRVTGYSDERMMYGGINLLSSISIYYLGDEPIFTKYTLTPLLCKHLDFSINQCTIWYFHKENRLISPLIDDSIILCFDDRINIKNNEFNVTIWDSPIIFKEVVNTYYGKRELSSREDGSFLVEMVYIDSIMNSIKRFFKTAPYEYKYISEIKNIWKPLQRPKEWIRMYGIKVIMPFIFFLSIILIGGSLYLYCITKTRVVNTNVPGIYDS